MYQHDNNFEIIDSLELQHMKDSLFVNVYSSEFDTSFVLKIDTLINDTVANLSLLNTFNFKGIKYNGFNDSIVDGTVTEAITTSTPNSITVSYIFNGTYKSVTSPNLNNTIVNQLLINRQYLR